MNEMNEECEAIVVYGNLLKGERNEEWCGRPRYRQPCVIHGILMDTCWGYPAFIPDTNERDIYAEIIEIPIKTLRRLEVLEGYPELYQKATIAARLPNDEVRIVSIYLLKVVPVGSVVVQAGDWRSRKK